MTTHAVHGPALTRSERSLLAASSAAFVVAAGAGAAFRATALWGPVGALQLENLRHAHSHLMTLGWVTPALFVLVAWAVSNEAGVERPAGLRRASWLSWATATTTFPVFLMWGYDPVSVGTATLPLGGITSGLATFAWYAWALRWWRWTRRMAPTTSLSLARTSVAMLLLASCGGWIRMGLTLRGLHHGFWDVASIHLFVDLFAQGWFVLATLAVLTAVAVPRDRAMRPVVAWLPITTPMLFVVALPAGITSVPIRLLGSGSAAASSALLLVVALRLWRAVATHRSRRILRPPVFALGVHAILLGALSVPGVVDAGEQLHLRILYLHVQLLGFVTASLLALTSVAMGRGRRLVELAHALIAALLVSLVPLSGAWPAVALGRGRWAFTAAFAAAVAVPVALAASSVFALRARRAEG